MARKRFKPEEIVAKLRQVEVLQSQGMAVVDAIRQNDFAFAANDCSEPKLTDAAPHSNGSNLGKTRRPVCVRYAYL